MRRDLDITLLRAFVAIVETGSVTGAARLLNRTQAAVSLQLKWLEDLLEQPLFERDHQRRLVVAIDDGRNPAGAACGAGGPLSGPVSRVRGKDLDVSHAV